MVPDVFDRQVRPDLIGLLELPPSNRPLLLQAQGVVNRWQLAHILRHWRQYTSTIKTARQKVDIYRQAIYFHALKCFVSEQQQCRQRGMILEAIGERLDRRYFIGSMGCAFRRWHHAYLKMARHRDGPVVASNHWARVLRRRVFTAMRCYVARRQDIEEAGLHVKDLTTTWARRHAMNAWVQVCQQHQEGMEAVKTVSHMVRRRELATTMSRWKTVYHQHLQLRASAMTINIMVCRRICRSMLLEWHRRAEMRAKARRFLLSWGGVLERGQIHVAFYTLYLNQLMLKAIIHIQRWVRGVITRKRVGELRDYHEHEKAVRELAVVYYERSLRLKVLTAWYTMKRHIDEVASSRQEESQMRRSFLCWRRHADYTGRVEDLVSLHMNIRSATAIRHAFLLWVEGARRAKKMKAIGVRAMVYLRMRRLRAAVRSLGYYR